MSGLVGEYRLSYRITPGLVSEPSPDAFVAIALMAAMVRNEPLELAPPATASPLLLSNLERLQEIFHVWNPAFRRVPVIATAAVPPPPRPGSAAFFSGGVDSLYTFLQNETEITHLIQLHGFEYRRQNRSLAQEAEERNRRFADARRRQLVIVETNVRELFEAHNVHIYAYHGACLASVAHVLGFARVRVPASRSWAGLGPWGSDPITDPLWSTESVEIVHHGCGAKRPDKVRRLGADAQSLALLRVCPQNSVYNCGRCEKCLRTRVVLRMLGLSSPNLPPLDDVRPLRGLRLDYPWQRADWIDNLCLAVEVGDRPAARAISVAIARYDTKQALRSLDRAVLSGSLRRLRARLLGAASQVGPILPSAPEPELGRWP